MGNKRGHKGGHRRFTNPQEIEFRKQKEEREREWRRQRGEISDEEDEENSQEDESSSEEEDLRKKSEEARKRNQQKKTEVEEDEESSEEEALIEICNPNRMPQKAKKNVTLDDKVVLSRKEREEIEKQKAKDHYQKLTAEGKTKEAQDDLARLALVRQRREEAAKKKKELAKNEEKSANSASTSKTKK